MYSSVKKESDGKYYVQLPSRKIEIIDDIPYLEYFANGGCPIEFMKDVAVWGEDLTLYKDFADTVAKNIELIKSGKDLI